MAATVSDTDAYYKVHKSLHLFTYEAVSSVDNALKVWHANQQQTLPVCTGQCPNGKKPKIPSSCQNCVAWGNAIEAAFYPPPVPPAKPQITWQNVTQSNLGKSHIEAAKAYVLRLPKTKGSRPSQYTRIPDFDIASVLMIMARFSEFHGGDQVIYNNIMKVIEIRNSLSHMGLHTNMLVDDQKVKEYFHDLESLARCLAQLHPHHFTSAQNVIDKLRMIQMETVTDKMRDEINLELRTEILKLKDKNKNTCSFDLTQCQRQLKADYKATRSGIAFLPGMPKKFSLDEFFVNLNLVEEEERPTEVIKKTLVQYTDLFTLENRSRERLCHVLIRGEAGSGKTTLINRLAHQWATGSNTDGADEAQSPLNEFELVFALNIRNMKPGMDLVDCIQDQLLPDLSRESIHSMLIFHADKCLFLFDGYDELKSHQEVLSSKLLHRSFVIVTTRPDKVDQFGQMHSSFVHVQLIGFSKESKETFISRYFASATAVTSPENTSKDIADELIKRIEGTYLDPLSLFPLLLAMMCSIYSKYGDIPSRMTALYEQTVDVFATQSYAKTSSSAYLSKTQRMEIDNVLLSLGPTALRGMLIHDGKLIFKKEHFQTDNCYEQTDSPIWMILLYGILPSLGYELGTLFDSSSLQFVFCIIGLFTGYILHYFASLRETVDLANKLGLLSKIYNHRIQKSENCEYSFLHKTFQEFAAARYWSSLVASNRNKFEYYLNRINKDNVKSMQYLLRFSCGLSYDAAEIILQHVVSVCKVDWRLAVTLLYEADRGSLIHPTLHSILSPLKMTIKGGYNENAELWSILHHYVNHKQVEGEGHTWLNNIKELAIDVVGDNIEDLTRFITNGVDFMTIGKSLTSLEMKMRESIYYDFSSDPFASQISSIDPSALQTSLIRFCRQLQLRHLGLADVCDHLNQMPTLFDWKLITTESFTKLIPKLESIALEGEQNVSAVLDIFVNVGKELKKQNVVTSRNRSFGNTNCLQKLGLSIRKFYVFESILINATIDFPIREFNTGDSRSVHSTGKLYKLKEALSYMPSLEDLRLFDIGLTAASLRVLLPAISRMRNIQVLDLNANDLQGAGNVLSEVLHSAANLSELILADTYLTDDDIRLLSLNHPSTLQLTTIDLSWNPFGSYGLIHLSGLMRHTPMLRKLCLTENEVYVNGVAEFSPALHYVPLLTHLDITLRDEESCILLAQGFRHVPKLQHLDLTCKWGGSWMLNVKSAEAIFRNLLYLLHLQKLTIPPMSFEGIHNSDIVRKCILVILAPRYNWHDDHYSCDMRVIREIKGIVSRLDMKCV